MAKKAKRKPIKRLQWADIWSDNRGKEYIDLCSTRRVARMEAENDRRYEIPSRVARVRITEVR